MPFRWERRQRWKLWNFKDNIYKGFGEKNIISIDFEQKSILIQPLNERDVIIKKKKKE